MGMSSLPEAIHMNRVERFAEALGVSPMDWRNALHGSEVVGLMKAKDKRGWKESVMMESEKVCGRARERTRNNAKVAVPHHQS